MIFLPFLRKKSFLDLTLFAHCQENSGGGGMRSNVLFATLPLNIPLPFCEVVNVFQDTRDIESRKLE